MNQFLGPSNFLTQSVNCDPADPACEETPPCDPADPACEEPPGCDPDDPFCGPLPPDESGKCDDLIDNDATTD